MKKLFTLISCTLAFFSQVKSQALFTEDFVYTSTGSTATDTLSNSAIGGALWKKHSGTGNPIKFLPTGLTYVGYAGSGVGGAISFANITTSAEDANTDIGANTTGTIYASFMLNVTVSGGTTSDYFFHFGDQSGSSIGSNFRGRLFIKDGASTGTFQLGISKGGASTAAVFSATSYNLNQTYLVVIKYKFNSATTSDDVVSAYILTSGVPTTEPTTADITATDNATDLSTVKSIIIRQGTTGVAAAMADGFRVGNSWINSVLPVTLKSISASLINNQPQVNWETSNETNFDYFGVEKSFDAKNFAEIAKVASNKASNGSAYQYADINKTLSTQFYRLKMVDNDGTFKYSSVVAVNAKPTISLALYPNPVTNTIILSHPKAMAGAVVKVTSIDGKILSTQNVQTSATQTSIDATRLVKGNYVVSFVNDGVSSTTQLVKQ